MAERPQHEAQPSDFFSLPHWPPGGQ